MATRLTYTTGARSPELDRAFEAALAEAREREAEPLAHLVSGRDAAVGEPFAREDPSRREQVASRAREGAELAAEAVEAARSAQREWRRLPHAERVASLRETERLIDERKLELAAAISFEVGKVRTESIAEVEEAIDLIETYCRQVESAEGFETPLGQLSPDERNTDVGRGAGRARPSSARVPISTGPPRASPRQHSASRARSAARARAPSSSTRCTTSSSSGWRRSPRPTASAIRPIPRSPPAPS